jgi:hypothetical protein
VFKNDFVCIKTFYFHRLLSLICVRFFLFPSICFLLYVPPFYFIFPALLLIFAFCYGGHKYECVNSVTNF